MEPIAASIRWGLAGIVLFAALPAAAAPRPATERMLPDSTVVVVSTPDAKDLSARFLNTALGRMCQDPQLSPLVGQIHTQLSDTVGQAKDRIGLSFDELLSLPQGEVTFAVVAMPETVPAVVLLVDTGEQVAAARKLLDKAAEALEASGATKSEEALGEVKLSIYDNARNAGMPQVAWFEREGVVVTSGNAEVLRRIAKIWNGEKAETLADNFAYASIMNRCRGEKIPAGQLSFFFDPIGLFKGIAVRNPGMQLGVAMLTPLGLDGLSGMGGTIAFDAGQFDTLAHLQVLLRSPRKGVLKILALEEVDLQPERFVPENVAAYTTVGWNFDNAYKSLAELYDGFRGEGALSKSLGQSVVGPTGVDIEKEIMPELAGRMSTLTWYDEPITLASQAQMVILKLKQTEAVAASLAKAAERFPERITKKSSGGQTYYQVDIPTGRPNPQGDARPNRQNDMAAMPQPCFGILDGCFVASNRPSLYEKAIAVLAAGNSLGAALDFKLVAAKLDRQAAGSKPVLFRFERPEQTLRYYHGLASGQESLDRIKRMGQRTPFFRGLDATLEKAPLPAFEQLQRYFAPSGAMLIDDSDGFHYTSFTLRRKAE